MDEPAKNTENNEVDSQQNFVEEEKSNFNISNNQKQCKSCFQEIHSKAKVCHLCSRGQSFLGRYFSYTTITISVLISIVMMIFAGVQLTLAFGEKEDASRARQMAEDAASKAEGALARIIADANEITKLKHTVEMQGAQVETVSKMAIQASRLSTDMEVKLIDYDLKIQKFTEVLGRFQLMNAFMMTVVKAQADDRKAFDQLEIWSNDETFFFHSEAFKNYVTIVDEHNQPRFKKLPDVPWKEGIDPPKLSFSDLKHDYENSHWYFKPSMIKYIYERSDISKYDRLEFLIGIVKNDSSLRAVEYAGRFLQEETGLNVKTLAISKFIDWWGEHKVEYREESQAKETTNSN